MPEQSESEYEKQERWRSDVRAFVFDLFKHWAWWLSATIGSGFAALCAAWMQRLPGGGKMIPFWVYETAVATGLVVASFRAYCGQRRIAEEANKKSEKQEEQIRALKQSKAHRAMIDRVLASYFKAIDTNIDLMKTFEGDGEITKGGETFIKFADLFGEIRKFIEENIGATEAAIFGAKNDNMEKIKNEKTADFWGLAVESMTDKMLKLKEIMRKQSNP
jgi:hypothetical protein